MQSLRVQMSVSTALHLVAQHRMQGVLVVRAALCDMQDVPLAWSSLTVIDATQDYSRAKARVLLELEFAPPASLSDTQSESLLPLKTNFDKLTSVASERPSDRYQLSTLEVTGFAEKDYPQLLHEIDRPLSVFPHFHEALEVHQIGIDRPKLFPQKRNSRRLPPLIPALLLLLVVMLLVGGSTYALRGLVRSSDPSNGSTSLAMVTITPIRKDFEKTYSIIAVSGNPNVAQHEIASRLLTATKSESESITATGIGTAPAIQAKGILGFYSAEGPFTYTAGTVFTDDFRSGYNIQIILDATVTVSSGQPNTSRCICPCTCPFGRDQWQFTCGYYLE